MTSFVKIFESLDEREEVEEATFEERAAKGGKAVKVIGERVFASFDT